MTGPGNGRAAGADLAGRDPAAAPPPRVAVTGATGFIGGALVRRLAAAGWDVVALARRAPADLPAGAAFAPYDLARPVEPAALAGSSALVHCAYAPNDVEQNVAAAERLLAASRAAGVGRNVFLSSLSAREDAASAYGRQKWLVERGFSGPRDAVVRAGLVVGAGGLFAAMAAHVRAGKPIPVIEGGSQPVQVVALPDLAAAILRVLERDLAGTFVVAHPEPVPYRDLHAALARRAGVRPRFLPVPFGLLDLALRAGEALRLPLAVRRDSLLGLRAMAAVDPRPDLARLGLSVRSFAEALEALPP